MLPIGVLLPTRNSMALLPGHLASLQPWLAEAAEVVVVDSHSQDGTREFLQANLRHPRTRFLDHPPGLYQSWNFGVAQIQAPFAYISAIGDRITGEGLAHLLDVAERLRCDVVVSKPRFVDAQGRPAPAPRWPVDDLIETLAAREPAAVEGLALLVFALANLTGALLGSSASNLYRTTCLRARPFPTDFGTAGDGAWGLQHALDIRLGVTPRIFSEVRDHPKSYDVREYAVEDLPGRFLRLAVDGLRQRRQTDPALDQQCAAASVDALVEIVGRQRAAQRALDDARTQRLPWILNPRAWQARLRRAALRRDLQRCQRDCLARLQAAAASR